MVLTVRELFDFVTDVNITDETVDDYIQKMIGNHLFLLSSLIWN